MGPFSRESSGHSPGAAEPERGLILTWKSGQLWLRAGELISTLVTEVMVPGAPPGPVALTVALWWPGRRRAGISSCSVPGAQPGAQGLGLHEC